MNTNHTLIGGFIPPNYTINYMEKRDLKEQIDQCEDRIDKITQALISEPYNRGLMDETLIRERNTLLTRKSILIRKLKALEK